MSKSDNPFLDMVCKAFKTFEDIPDTGTFNIKHKPRKEVLLTQLENTIDELIKQTYRQAFEASVGEKGPRKFDPVKSMDAGRALVRETVETKLNQIMADFYESGEKV